MALTSPSPIGVGIGHGCSPLATPAIVTRAEGRIVRRLDGRDAEVVYLEKLGCAEGHLDDEQFATLATVHPLAQPELRGDVRLRHVLGRAAGGGIEAATHIPENAAVEFTQQSPGAIVRSTFDAVSDAIQPLEGAPARAALVFDCAGRRNALGGPGPALDAEVEALVGSFGEQQPELAGAYTRARSAGSTARKETATMQSWSLRSAERQDTDPTMLRRFVEASRRAEIIALVNSAGSDAELGEVVTAELCEAFEAEVAFMVAARAEAPPTIVGSMGLSKRQGEKLLHDPLCMGALGAVEPVAKRNQELSGVEMCDLALAGTATGRERS